METATGHLRPAYDELLAEATVLAGGLTDLAQRATVYRQLFRDSGRNHIFPLIAAHGALWAQKYFHDGLALGRKFVWQYFYSSRKRAAQLAALDDFANAFRDINRRVCVDTYANFHFTAKYGDDPCAARFVAPELLTALRTLHQARGAGVTLTLAAQRSIFVAHFMDEQRNIVGPAISAAIAQLQWPLLRFLALRPLIRFAYFRQREALRFWDFSAQTERVENGLQAFEVGGEVGWDRVELALLNYATLPARFFTEPEAHYAAVRAAALAG